MTSPEPPEDRGPIDCPKCRARMGRETVEGVEIDRCPDCGGLWLDALEKEKLVVTASAVRAADPAAGPDRHEVMDGVQRIRCPRDHSTMIHVVDPEQPHVGFESCTVCGGVHLDAGELRDLADLSLLERLRSSLGSG